MDTFGWHRMLQCIVQHSAAVGPRWWCHPVMRCMLLAGTVHWKLDAACTLHGTHVMTWYLSDVWFDYRLTGPTCHQPWDPHCNVFDNLLVNKCWLIERSGTECSAKRRCVQGRGEVLTAVWVVGHYCTFYTHYRAVIFLILFHSAELYHCYVLYEYSCTAVSKTIFSQIFC